MEFYVMACTYNVYGGHSALSLVPELLLGDAGSFGSAISELTVTFHFPHSGPPRRTLEELYAEFEVTLRSLPKVVYRRKRSQAAIDIASELIDGKCLERDCGLSLPLVKGAVAETVTALTLLRKRLTANDDFNLEAFLTHCEKAQSRLPATAEGLAEFARECEQRQAAREAARSPWEKLGIDWRDFHPDARQLLDAPFFWEGSNDFAPHGNDTGADLLAEYRKWLRRHPADDPVTFYRQLISRWGFPARASNDLEQSVLDAAAIGLAFAELKLRAECRPAAARLARAAINRQRKMATDAVTWPHREERLKSLDLLQAKLRAGR